MTNWIYERKDQVWKVVRQVEHSGYHSTCDSDVLFKAAGELRTGAVALGYNVPAPPTGRNAQVYKDWIVRVAQDVLRALEGYRFLECTLSKAETSFKAAESRLEACTAALNDVDDSEPYFLPA